MYTLPWNMYKNLYTGSDKSHTITPLCVWILKNVKNQFEELSSD